jgi:hypothetical protein
MSKEALATDVVLDQVRKHIVKVSDEDVKDGKLKYLCLLRDVLESSEIEQFNDLRLKWTTEAFAFYIDTRTSEQKKKLFSDAKGWWTAKLTTESKTKKKQHKSSRHISTIFIDVEWIGRLLGSEHGLLLVQLPMLLQYYDSELGRKKVLYAVIMANLKLQDGELIEYEASDKRDGTAMDTGDSSGSTELVSRMPTQHGPDAMRTTSNAHEAIEGCSSATATASSEHVLWSRHKRRRLSSEAYQEPVILDPQGTITAATQGQAGSAVDSGDTGNSSGPTARVSQGPCQFCGHQPSSNLPFSNFCPIDEQKEATFWIDAATMRDNTVHSDHAVDEGRRQSRHPVSNDQDAEGTSFRNGDAQRNDFSIAIDKGRTAAYYTDSGANVANALAETQPPNTLMGGWQLPQSKRTHFEPERPIKLGASILTSEQHKTTTHSVYEASIQAEDDITTDTALYEMSNAQAGTTCVQQNTGNQGLFEGYSASSSNPYQIAGQSTTVLNENSTNHQNQQIQWYAHVMAPAWTMMVPLIPCDHTEIQGTSDVVLTYKWDAWVALSYINEKIGESVEHDLFKVTLNLFPFETLLDVIYQSYHWQANTKTPLGDTCLRLDIQKNAQNTDCKFRCVIPKIYLPPGFPKIVSSQIR